MSNGWKNSKISLHSNISNRVQFKIINDKSLDEFSDSASNRIVLYNTSRKTINRQKVDMEEKSALSLNFFQHTILPLSASQKILRKGFIPYICKEQKHFSFSKHCCVVMCNTRIEVDPIDKK